MEVRVFVWQRSGNSNVETYDWAHTILRMYKSGQNAWL